MDIYTDYINRSKEKCRIRFEVSTNMQAANHTKQPLWTSDVTGVGLKVRILDSALVRLNKKKGGIEQNKFRIGSAVFIDTTITVPEIIKSVESYMLKHYDVEKDSLVVSATI